MDDANPMQRLLEIMRRLRDLETGCPWDIVQSFETIAPYTIEEAYEVADAIERKQWQELKLELGDLLLQVVYHSRMAEEAGLFDFDAVATAISDKMVERHPHVFGEVTITDAEAQTRAWEDLKATERQTRSVEPVSALEGVPIGLPGLLRAMKLQKRAARSGFDWPDKLPVLDKIREEIDELEATLRSPDARSLQEDEFGDLLFTMVNFGRHSGFEPEQALQRAANKFERRFRALERVAAERGIVLEQSSIEQLEAIWQEVKAREQTA